MVRKASAAANELRQLRRKRVWIVLWLLTGLGTLTAGWWVWQNAFRREALPVFAAPAEQFKYGALGYGTPGVSQGFPLYLWQVLPEVFADKLPGPGGWASFGLVTEPGMAYPVGFAKVTVGFPGLVPNCALCHSGTLRTRPDEPPRLLLGAPAHQLNFDAFNEFVFACAADPRWRVSDLLPRIEQITRLSWSERLFYRVLIPVLRLELVRQRGAFAWQASRPAAGCGRTDAFNRFKINVLALSDDGTIGTSDYPPLWNQRQREGHWLHWNGSANNLREDHLLSVLPIIKGPSDFDPRGFDRVETFLRDLPPPKFPFPVDAARAERGQALFVRHCAGCHAFGAAQTGQVTPLQEVGTDAAFLGMWSTNFVARLKAIDSPPFKFPALRIAEGYVNVLLDGLWLRAPYLHNGSVPTLWDLLQSPKLRPTQFRRGYNLYDAQHVGFISAGSEAATTVTLYDTRQPGNGNQGHLYGTTLTDEEKWQLLEYLKTL